MIASKRQPNYPLALGIIALLLVFYASRQAIVDLFAAWQTEEYSHGLLIPFIALLLAWHRLTETKPVRRPSWLGIPCLAITGGLLLLAQLSTFLTAAEYGLIVALVGLSLAFFGRRATVLMLPAFFYCVFAVPLPHLVQAVLSQKMQLLSSSIGVAPLDLFGIPVYQEGNIIDLGGYRLQVAEACSGLRYLFPLMSFGYLIAYLLKDKLWKRLVIFFSAIPIAIILNSLRITLVGVTVDFWGGAMAEGFIHSFEGWVVFLICVSILLGEAWVLRHIGKRGSFRYAWLAPARGWLFDGYQNIKGPRETAVIGALLLVFLSSHSVIDRQMTIPVHPPLAAFPLTLDNWHGKQEGLTPDILAALQLSDYWIASYARTDNAVPVNLYIAYYGSQHVGSATHTPSNCMPGGGWQIDNSRTETVRLADGETIDLTRLLIRRDGAAEIVYYWFDERGHDMTETYSAKWYLLRDAILMHRSDGAVIRLITPLANGETEGAGDRRLTDFLSLAYPEIKGFIPGAKAFNPVAGP
jgi:exosortase D (VPLPA-CTERM-specific)